MEHVEVLRDGASAPAFRQGLDLRREHNRRYSANARGVVKEPSKYSGELPPSQRWVIGHEGRYSIDEFGVVRSYCRPAVRILATTTRNGYLCVKVFHEDEAVFWKVGDLVAQAFLNTTDYIFMDGDRTHVQLSNLCRRSDAMGDNEKAIDGFGGDYTIDRNGVLRSYKNNCRKSLTWSKSLCRSLRVTLVKADDQITVYRDRLMQEHFGAT